MQRRHEASDAGCERSLMKRLAILGSTRGSHLDYIVNAIRQNELSATINIVMSNKLNAPILERAKNFGLTTDIIDVTGTREECDARVTAKLRKHSIDLIILMGYMRILSADFIHAWENKIINIHPSLLPAHAGKMDLDVHRSVLAAGELETGCTVHYVTEHVDAGPIILQKKCQVLITDTPETLKARVQQCESAALIEAIRIFTI